MGNVHTLSVGECDKITTVKALGNVHTLTIYDRDNISDICVRALPNVNKLELQFLPNKDEELLGTLLNLINEYVNI